MASSPARFAYSNLLTVAGVVVTSNSEQADYPDDFALNPAPWKPYRSAVSTVAEWWKADLGSNKDMTCALIRGWARPGSGQIKFQANASDAWGAPTIDTAFTLPASNPTQVIALYFASVSLRWVRFYSPNAGAASGYFQLGVPFVGTYYQPSPSVQGGPSISVLDPTPLVSSPDGQVIAQALTISHAFVSRFRGLNATHRDNFLTMYRTVGRRTPVFYALDHTNVDQTLYGRFGGEFPVAHDEQNDYWAVGVPFQEER